MSKKQNRDIQYDFPPKIDNEFRIHMKTNRLGNHIVMCFEYPDGTQVVRNYGNIPSFETLTPYEGLEFELIIDGISEGKKKLIEANKMVMKYE